MNRLLFIVLALFAITGCKVSEPISSEETSPSGIHFSLMQMSGTDDVVVQVAWPTDWTYREGLNEAVPFVGADLILAGGADGYPAGQAGEKFADLKAEGRLFSSTDFVFGWLKFKKTTQAEAIEIANAHLRAPTFNQAWLERVRDGWDKNMTEAATKPQTKLFNTVRWAVLGPQPLRTFLALDTPGLFASVKREDVQQWDHEVLTRSPKAIVVAGAASPQEAGAMVDALFDGLPAASHEIKAKPIANFAPRRILLHSPEATTSQLLFIKSIPPTSEGKELEDVLITSALGGDDRSALFKAVRTELRATYGFSAGTDNYSHLIRVLYMTGEIETSKLAEAEKIVRKAYGDFRQSEPSGDLALWKTPLNDWVERTKQTPDALSDTTLRTLIDDQPAARALNLKKELEAVTSDAVKARLNESYPKPDDFLMVAISPDATALPGACVIESPQDAVKCP